MYNSETKTCEPIPEENAMVPKIEKSETNENAYVLTIDNAPPEILDNIG